ncbi:MAG: efflux transporter periplasmic adaptor subunit [Acidobacteria bacterium]|nr:MAG: efflux transporter periplasmic adaptor subunit [Acidobacteriota bacterium]
MAKRMILMLTVMAVVVAALGFVKFQQVKAAMAVYASFQPPPEAVTTIVARQEQWPATLGAIGTVAAVRGVTVSADLPGLVEKIAFDSGQPVQEGDVLVQLDTRQERAQLTAAEAQRDLSHSNLERMRSLTADRIVAQAEFDQAEATNKTAEANAGEIRATIGRKTIRAPFAGVLGLRQVNLGQYLTAGAAIVSLQSLNPIYVNFAVPQQQVATLKVGTEVRVTTENAQARASGRVTAIDSVVDQATRNAQIQATFPNANGKLHPGMFVQANVLLGTGETVVTLPASAINYAPYGDSVFVVGDVKGPKGDTYRGVLQRFVRLGGSRGDQIAVLSGVKTGEEVVTSGVFKLRNGAAVQVNNTIQPSNSPAPRVEDR